MTSEELSQLKSRCLMAANHGYKIARAEIHIEQLKKIVGYLPLPPDPVKAILTLIEVVEGLREIPKVEEPIPMTLRSEPVPDPVPVEPDPVPVEPDPVPVEPDPVPVEPDPVPVEAEIKPELAPTPEPKVTRSYRKNRAN